MATGASETGFNQFGVREAPDTSGSRPASALLALAHYKRGRVAAAFDEAERVLAINACDIDALRVSAMSAASCAASEDNSLEGLRRAERYGARAVHALGEPRTPGDALILLTHACTLATLYRHDEALPLMRLAERFSNHASVCYYLAQLYFRRAEAGKHREWCERAFSCPHVEYEHTVQRLQAQLHLGEWSAMSTLMEMTHGPTIDDGGVAPPWDGESLTDGTLLVHRSTARSDCVTAYGFGDLMQCSIFLRSVAKRVRWLLVDVPPALTSLYTSSFRDVPNLELVDISAQGMPAHDRSVDFFALIGMFYRELDGAPTLAPRGGPAPSLGPGLHVGVCWAATGRPIETARMPYYYRQLPLAAFTPLYELPNVTLHSLQVGASEADLDAFPAIRRHRLVTFADTARLAVALDVVVTVDTSVAHLCGCLGVPTLMPLAAGADWRWGMEGETTLWYRSMRILRQPKPGAAWEPLIAQARDRIATGDLPPRLCAARVEASVGAAHGASSRHDRRA